MQKLISLILLVCISQNKAGAQSADEAAILKIMDEQTQNWNKGDLNRFVTGYWNNDSLMFIGSNGVVYGYANTLTRYKKTYSDTSKMGKLRVEILHVTRLSPEYYFMVGKWFLTRSIGNVNGSFSLLFRKVKGQWKIVADHSS